MQLCKEIIQGCRAQLREDGRVFVVLVGIGPRESESWSDKKVEAKTERPHQHPDHQGNQEEFKDSVTGQPLIAQLVREARRKEMEYFEPMKVWIRRNRSEGAHKRQVGRRE